MSWANVPSILKHCALAIWTDGSLGRGVAGLRAAWMVARSRLVEYGYLARGSEEGPIDNIRLTSKGVLQNRKHLRESRGKDRRFDSVFEVILRDLAGPAPGGSDAAKETKAPPPGVGKEPIATPPAPMGATPTAPSPRSDLPTAHQTKHPAIGKIPSRGKEG